MAPASLRTVAGLALTFTLLALAGADGAVQACFAVPAGVSLAAAGRVR